MTAATVESAHLGFLTWDAKESNVGTAHDLKPWSSPSVTFFLQQGFLDLFKYQYQQGPSNQTSESRWDIVIQTSTEAKAGR